MEGGGDFLEEAGIRESAAAKLSGSFMMTRTGDAVILRFPDRRRVLSTSWLNGGYREDLGILFNHQIPLAACEACHTGSSVKEYLSGVARNLGLDPQTCSGLVTRADMRNTAVANETYRDLTVTAIITAGIDKNGGRAGDPASYYQDGTSFEPVGGTINTILVIGADLPEYAMARAVMTATEAKTAALQQLMARSMYSSGIATGSGTDMIAIVADPNSPLCLTDAGKHAKLGELIGTAVIRATTLALERETGLCAETQRDVLVRLARYGVTADDLWAGAAGFSLSRATRDSGDRDRFIHHLESQAKDPAMVALVAAALHLVDEAEWGLLPREPANLAIHDLFSKDPGVLPAARDDDNPLDVLVRGLAGLMERELSGDGVS